MTQKEFIPYEQALELIEGDRIDIGTGYSCDKGTFKKYEGDNVVWESDADGEYKTPLDMYTITKIIQ